MIPFNVPPCVGDELEYVKQAIDSHKICGDGAFTKQCNAWLEERFHAQKVLLTTSGTTALDMAMLLCDIQPGDEVILPSFTFSSTATSAVLAGLQLRQALCKGGVHGHRGVDTPAVVHPVAALDQRGSLLGGHLFLRVHFLKIHYKPSSPIIT